MASPPEALAHAPLEWDTPLFLMAVAQFDQAVPVAEIPDEIAERLRFPERSLIVSVPVRMDDGRRVVFPGYRVQHSSILGPTKGGIRYDSEVSLGECAALAMWMTWKCALLRLPYGGAKGGVRCNARELSLTEIERLTRRFTSELLPVIGPQEDIPAPDMATNEQTMAWMMDTYSMQRGYAVPEIVTGKPISIGGSVFRHEATGAGVVMVIARACARLGRPLGEQRCVVQGFGNVGSIAAAELEDHGAKVIAVSDVSGGIYAEAGLDVRALLAYLREHGSLEGCDAGLRITNEELLELDCDILVLAAREDQITAENAPRIRARMIAEGANGPTSIEADAILAERGILDPPGHPHERWRRDGVVLRVGAGPRASLLDARGDPSEARREALVRVRPGLGPVGRGRPVAADCGSLLGHPRGVQCARGAGDLPVSDGVVRDAMVSHPGRLAAGETAQAAGELLDRPEVRAVYVTDGETFVGVVTRKTLVREVVAAGRDPRTTLLGTIAEPPERTIGPDVPLDDAFRLLESEDAERVPVVDDEQRLIGVLSRSVLQRRLLEDEPPPEEEEPPELPPAA